MEFLPEGIRDELAAAQMQGRRKRASRSVQIGEEAFAILDMSDEGFAVDDTTTPHLRGLVDIFEGPRHLYQALIVAAARDGELMRYDFKRNTAASDTAPVDFEQPDNRPIALLTKT
ncbi:hypothetical protein [Hasllibacter sp. MH4015]|uniref:hypothetical protein n=1 Tax=Hasllibacter sp. MH4015 TaxID=2854029 RepID=UPI001CD628C3|nr:hypothetical protein [Hasllibacter sp. MH4015]